ncbi:hypothetical protein I3760_14G024600 [Carya illinoinensis]|nr:hypothetical protein I3760_14G024600 [Carya illinoinensis]
MIFSLYWSLALLSSSLFSFFFHFFFLLRTVKTRSYFFSSFFLFSSPSFLLCVVAHPDPSLPLCNICCYQQAQHHAKSPRSAISLLNLLHRDVEAEDLNE